MPLTLLKQLEEKNSSRGSQPFTGADLIVHKRPTPPGDRTKARVAMTAHAIPEDVREFILQHIHSIAQLEALLLLLNNERGFSLEECASRLYISLEECKTALQPLIAARFIQTEEGRLRPADETITRKVKQLADVYRRQLIPVTNLIHSKQERIQKFADAFRVKKEP
jgi:hypothetical protein